MGNYFIMNTIHGNLTGDEELKILNFMKKISKDKFFAIDYGTIDSDGMHVKESTWGIDS